MFNTNNSIIQHVPVRVCKETGEQYLAPDTVDPIQYFITGNKKRVHMIETLVYNDAHSGWIGYPNNKNYKRYKYNL